VEVEKQLLGFFLILQLSHFYDRFIFICPGFYEQSIFRCVDHLVKRKDDIYINPNNNTFSQIKDDLETVNEYCRKNGQPKVRTLVFVDDLAGLHVIHGGRFGSFPHFAIASRHCGASMIVIAQQPTSVSPSFRDNVNTILAFPSNRKKDIDWLVQEYKSINMTNKEMEDLVKKAWRGKELNDYTEIGKHFLFIIYDPRSTTQYFSDFDYSITPKAIKQ